MRILPLLLAVFLLSVHAGEPALPVINAGPSSLGGNSFYTVISTQENLDALLKRLKGPSDYRPDFFEHQPPRRHAALFSKPRQNPDVDFKTQVVAFLTYGDCQNITDFYNFLAAEDETAYRLRYSRSGMQTFGRFGGGFHTPPYALVVLPRREGKAYIFESDESHGRGQPRYKQTFKLDKLGDPALELANLKKPDPAGVKPVLPEGFERKVEKYRTPPPEPEKDDPQNPFRNFRSLGSANKEEYEFYTGPDGKKVLHGFYRSFVGEGKDERNEWAGTYEDGRPHGEWKQWFGKSYGEEDSDGVEFSVSYHYGQLHGPVASFNRKGKPEFKGQFQHGKAHGVWTEYNYENTGVREEESFEDDLWHGPTRRYFPSGAKKEELNFVRGQMHGVYQRWHESGQLATRGEYIAGDTTPQRDNDYFFGELPGYRHGEWAHFGPDGKELWRGSFDRGTGAFVDFFPSGVKMAEGRFENGVRRGELKFYNKDGWLERIDDRAADGALKRTNFYENGVKKSVSHARNGVPHGVVQIFNRAGALEAEGEWKEGKPWHGDVVPDSHGGRIVRFENGVAQKTEPERFTQEAQLRREKEAARRQLLKVRGLDKESNLSAIPFAGEFEKNVDARVPVLLKEIVAAPQSAAATAARKTILDMGAHAAPPLAAALTDRDPAICAEARAALDRIPKKPGKAIAGVTISALAAGRPQPGEVLPVWITLTNTTAEDLWLFEQNWSLYAKARNTNQGRGKIGGGGGATWELSDFSLLKAGESRSELMDAIPMENARTAGNVYVYLQISNGNNAEKIVPGKLFESGSWIESQYFDVSYSPETPEPPHMEHVRALGNQQTRIAAEQALLKAGAAAIPALRMGLRLAEDDDRWRVFEYIGRHPHAELEEEMLAFWARWGNNWVFGRVLHGEAIFNFSRALPEARRLEFVQRAAALQPRNARALNHFGAQLSGGTDEEKAHALRYLETIYGRGEREHSQLNFLAWQYSRANPETLRNPRLALERAHEAVKAKEDCADCWHTLATVQMDQGKLEDALKSAERALDFKVTKDYQETLRTICRKLGREIPKRGAKDADF